MIEMIVGHKQFFKCEPRYYARMRLSHVSIQFACNEQGDLAESKCYSNTLRSYCVSAVDTVSTIGDCIENVMKKTIQKRDIYYDNRGESNFHKLDLIRSMLVLDPKRRISIDAALNHVRLEEWIEHRRILLILLPS